MPNLMAMHIGKTIDKQRSVKVKPTRKTLHVIMALVLGVFFLLNAGLAEAAKPILLRMAYPSADRGFAADMIKWWGSNVEKQTKGKVKIQYYWGGILGTSKEMLYSIQKGMCDVGVVFPMYFSTELPLTAANTCIIATYQNDPVQTTRAWKKLVQEFPQISAEWTAHNQKMLMGWEVGPYLWVSKKPIKTYADLKGLKTGVWGGKGPRQLATEMGSIPRSIASVEVYDALDKSTIDARAETSPMVKTYKHYEICHYISDVGVGTTGAPVYAMSINLKKWNSLPKDIQADITAVTEAWWTYFEKKVSEAQTGDKTFLEGKGMKFLTFSKEDKEKVSKLPVFANFRKIYVDRAKDHDLAAKIYDRYRALLAGK